MKLFGNKYYFVSAGDIEKALWVKLNDGYRSRGRVNADSFFADNKIPKEYQKIVLVVPFLKKIKSRMNEDAATKQNSYFAQELISEFQFCKVSQGNSGGQGIRLINIPFDKDLARNGIYDLVSLNLNGSAVSAEEVKKFVVGLKTRGLVTGYFAALNELFQPSMEAVRNLDAKRSDYSLGDVEKFIK